MLDFLLRFDPQIVFFKTDMQWYEYLIQPEFFAFAAAALSAIAAWRSAGAATKSTEIGENSLEHSKADSRQNFWRQMTDLFNQVNKQNGEAGLPGPREGQLETMEESLFKWFKYRKEKLQNNIEEIENAKNIEDFERRKRLDDAKKFAPHIILRASAFNQANIAHLYFHHRNNYEENSYSERARKWFVNGVCEWVKIADELSLYFEFYEDVKSTKSGLEETIEEWVKRGGLWDDEFRDSWVKQGLEEYVLNTLSKKLSTRRSEVLEKYQKYEIEISRN